MGHPLHLEVPEDVYESLVQSAEKTGQAPETLAVEWLAFASRDIVDDPLEPFIGAFASDVPDWAEKHDEYLGQAILEHMREEDQGEKHG